jgi:hypothetical protein
VIERLVVAAPAASVLVVAPLAESDAASASPARPATVMNVRVELMVPPLLE